MTNPYQAPKSALPPSGGNRPPPRWVHATITGVAFLIALFGFWGIAYFMVAHLGGMVSHGEISPLQLLSMFTMPALLVMATGFLVFRKKVGVFLLAGYLIWSLATTDERTRILYIANILFWTALLAYGLSEYKRGRLR